jgi:hypothetical protein
VPFGSLHFLLLGVLFGVSFGRARIGCSILPQDSGEDDKIGELENRCLPIRENAIERVSRGEIRCVADREAAECSQNVAIAKKPV